MQQTYFYTYLIGDGRYYKTDYALKGRKAFNRYVREYHGLDKINGTVKVIHRATKVDEPAYIGKAILVKKEVA